MRGGVRVPARVVAWRWDELEYWVKEVNGALADVCGGVWPTPGDTEGSHVPPAHAEP